MRADWRAGPPSASSTDFFAARPASPIFEVMCAREIDVLPGVLFDAASLRSGSIDIFMCSSEYGFGFAAGLPGAAPPPHGLPQHSPIAYQ